MSKQNEDEVYVLTPYACLTITLEEYGIPTSSITPKIGEHIVEDFMELMSKQGYLTKMTEEENG